MMRKPALVVSILIGFASIFLTNQASAEPMHGALTIRLADHLNFFLPNPGAPLSVPTSQATLQLVTASNPEEDLEADLKSGARTFMGIAWEGGVETPGVRCTSNIASAHHAGHRFLIGGRSGSAAHDEAFKDYAIRYNTALLSAGVLKPELQDNCSPVIVENN